MTNVAKIHGEDDYDDEPVQDISDEDISDDEFSANVESALTGGEVAELEGDDDPFDLDEEEDGPEDEVMDAVNTQNLSNEDLLRGKEALELVKEAKAIANQLLALEEDRASINADMAAVRESAQAKGFNKKAMAAAMIVSKLNEKEMDAFDATYKIMRKAMQIPVQDDLFG